MTNMIAPAVTIVALMILYPLLAKSAKRAHRQGENRIRMPRFAFWVGVVGIVFFGGCLVASLLFMQSEGLPYLVPGIFLLFTALCVLETSAATNWGIEYDDNGFVYRGYLGKTYRFGYDQILRVERTYNPMTRTYIACIHTQSKKIKLDALCVGLDAFLQHLDALDASNDFEKQKTTNPASQSETAGNVRMPRANLYTGIICSALFTAPIVWALADPSAFSGTGLETFVIFIGCIVLGLFTILQYLKWQVVYTESGIIHTNSFGKQTRIGYTDITAYETSNRNLILYAGKQKLQLPLNAKGMYEFQKTIDRNAALDKHTMQ